MNQEKMFILYSSKYGISVGKAEGKRSFWRSKDRWAEY
jgi:hypothetical protein